MASKSLRQNKIKVSCGKGKKGFVLGVQWYELFDWWHLAFGITFLFWYFTIELRWRVFGCGYKHFDKTDIYY